MKSYTKFILICWLGVNFCTAVITEFFLWAYFSNKWDAGSIKHSVNSCMESAIINLLFSIPMLILFAISTRIIITKKISRSTKIFLLQTEISLLIICLQYMFNHQELEMILKGKFLWVMPATMMTPLLVSIIFIGFFGRRFFPKTSVDLPSIPEPPVPPVTTIPAKKSYDLFD